MKRLIHTHKRRCKKPSVFFTEKGNLAIQSFVWISQGCPFVLETKTLLKIKLSI